MKSNFRQSSDSFHHPRLFSTICAVCGGLFVVGGRTSPSQPFLDPSFYDLQTQQWLSVSSEGSQPQPRWSHTMIRLHDSLCVLYGGRDSDHIFGDCWSVHIVKDDNHVKLTWFLLYDSTNTIYNANESPGTRFKCCMLPICNDSCQHDEVIVMGGMIDLDGTCMIDELMIIRFFLYSIHIQAL